jgi:hypothetical protein
MSISLAGVLSLLPDCVDTSASVAEPRRSTYRWGAHETASSEQPPGRICHGLDKV